MSKLYYTYKSYPNCSAATEYSRVRTPESIGIGIFGALLTLLIFAFSTSVEKTNYKDLFFMLLLVLGVLAFDYYAFIWRKYQTEYNLTIIFLEEEYRREAVYGETQYSHQFVCECFKKLSEKKSIAKNLYIKNLKRSSIIYSVVCVIIIPLFAMILL